MIIWKVVFLIGLAILMGIAMIGNISDASKGKHTKEVNPGTNATAAALDMFIIIGLTLIILEA